MKNIANAMMIRMTNKTTTGVMIKTMILTGGEEVKYAITVITILTMKDIKKKKHDKVK